MNVTRAQFLEENNNSTGTLLKTLVHRHAHTQTHT